MFEKQVSHSDNRTQNSCDFSTFAKTLLGSGLVMYIVSIPSTVAVYYNIQLKMIALWCACYSSNHNHTVKDWHI